MRDEGTRATTVNRMTTLSALLSKTCVYLSNSNNAFMLYAKYFSRRKVDLSTLLDK